MNQVVITQMFGKKASWFKVVYNDVNITMLNAFSLDYFLRRELGLKKTQRSSVFYNLFDCGTVVVELIQDVAA